MRNKEAVMINEAVKKLVTYGLETGLIENEDVIYTTNAILETLGISGSSYSEISSVSRIAFVV